MITLVHRLTKASLMGTQMPQSKADVTAHLIQVSEGGKTATEHKRKDIEFKGCSALHPTADIRGNTFSNGFRTGGRTTRIGKDEHFGLLICSPCRLGCSEVVDADPRHVDGQDSGVDTLARRGIPGAAQEAQRLGLRQLACTRTCKKRVRLRTASSVSILLRLTRSLQALPRSSPIPPESTGKCMTRMAEQHLRNMDPPLHVIQRDGVCFGRKSYKYFLSHLLWSLLQQGRRGVTQQSMTEKQGSFSNFICSWIDCIEVESFPTPEATRPIWALIYCTATH